MLEISYIRENQELVVQGLHKRHFPEASKVVTEIIEMDQARRESQTQADQAKAEMNAISKSIGQLMKAGKKEEANAAKAQTGTLKEQIQELNKEQQEISQKLQNALYSIPNVPAPQSPEGKTPEDNVVDAEFGEKPSLPSGFKPHWDLIKDYDIIDFELGNKITGAGFPVYKKQGARLQRALINYFLDHARDAGYMEIQPPILINEDSGRGTGQLPDKEGQMYYVQHDELYLIPTAEVPITNIYRDAILSEEELPIKLAGYTPCFRREAGSWGADVRGLNRLHQFDKVEIVQIQKPELSYDTLEEMLAHVKKLLDALKLPYRVLKLCAGDLGFTSAFTYDLEVYSAAQERWLEVSSVSNFETYQANRLQLRYRAKDQKKPQLTHTLNGSALALPRIVAALLENNQASDAIELPEVLHAYTGFETIRKG